LVARGDGLATESTKVNSGAYKKYIALGPTGFFVDGAREAIGNPPQQKTE
jgi:hypothetical protein